MQSSPLCVLVPASRHQIALIPSSLRSILSVNQTTWHALGTCFRSGPAQVGYSNAVVKPKAQSTWHVWQVCNLLGSSVRLCMSMAPWLGARN
jgi:hypothetical protein